MTNSAFVSFQKLDMPYLYTPLMPYSINTLKKQEIRFEEFVAQFDFEIGHMVPPLYWKFADLEILLFGDLSISFIFRDPCRGTKHSTPTILIHPRFSQ